MIVNYNHNMFIKSHWFIVINRQQKLSVLVKGKLGKMSIAAAPPVLPGTVTRVTRARAGGERTRKRRRHDVQRRRATGDRKLPLHRRAPEKIRLRSDFRFGKHRRPLTRWNEFWRRRLGEGDDGAVNVEWRFRRDVEWRFRRDVRIWIFDQLFGRWRLTFCRFLAHCRRCNVGTGTSF